ncbi:MAG: metallophosphoesterase [Candidatus Obscuribacterales bacterium]|nr:metallophosphoesterase [Candidatus Obscuribacterales bacterium]
MRKPYVISLGLLALGAGVYAYACREARTYRREHLRLSGPNNSQAANGASPKTLRILHISDLHLAANESRAKLDFLARVTDDDYDFVFLTGDIFQHDESIRHAKVLLSRRPRLGAYAVLGNHDLYKYTMYNKIVGRIFPSFRHPAKQNKDVEPLIGALESVGYDVLRNEARYLEEDGICLVGVDFPGIRKNRLLELVSRSPGDWLVLALFHLPKDLWFYSDAGVHYAFGGHTHGGQIRVPGVGAIITDSELERHEASGVTYRGRTTFHVSRGLGADPRTNFRLFCPPQASVIEIEVPANCALATASAVQSGVRISR